MRCRGQICGITIHDENRDGIDCHGSNPPRGGTPLCVGGCGGALVLAETKTSAYYAACYTSDFGMQNEADIRPTTDHATFHALNRITSRVAAFLGSLRPDS